MNVCPSSKPSRTGVGLPDRCTPPLFNRLPITFLPHRPLNGRHWLSFAEEHAVLYALDIAATPSCATVAVFSVSRALCFRSCKRVKARWCSTWRRRLQPRRARLTRYAYVVFSFVNFYDTGASKACIGVFVCFMNRCKSHMCVHMQSTNNYFSRWTVAVLLRRPSRC